MLQQHIQEENEYMDMSGDGSGIKPQVPPRLVGFICGNTIVIFSEPENSIFIIKFYRPAHKS